METGVGVNWDIRNSSLPYLRSESYIAALGLIFGIAIVLAYYAAQIGGFTAPDPVVGIPSLGLPDEQQTRAGQAYAWLILLSEILITAIPVFDVFAPNNIGDWSGIHPESERAVRVINALQIGLGLLVVNFVIKSVTRQNIINIGFEVACGALLLVGVPGTALTSN